MIYQFKGTSPSLGKDCFLAPGSAVIGDVEMGDDCSVWFGSVVRGDVNSIKMGKGVNVQDLAALHVTQKLFPLTIGNGVSIGHNATVHGCTLGDNVLIGIGAAVLDGAIIGEESIVAAGAVVPEGATFPPRSLLMGIPAKRVREVSDLDLERIEYTTNSYLALKGEYLDGEVDNG